MSPNAKDAIANQNRLILNNSHLAIYTDGSGIQNKTGASAVTMFTPWEGATPLVARKKQACLGSDQEFTVYFGELYGLWMALDLIAEDNRGRKTFVFTVNQAAILSSEQPKQQTGPYLLQEIALRIEALPGQLEISWIPASVKLICSG